MDTNGLTLEEQATNFVTMRHIERVRNLINMVVKELLRRGEMHDQSKLEHPEVEAFTEYTPKLATTEFGSSEYLGFKKAMAPALEHHYAKNSHHPEHYKHGVEDMDILDVVEMLLDWFAASERHNTGNLRKSIEINAKHFGIDSQLVKIMENSVDFLEG